MPWRRSPESMPRSGATYIGQCEVYEHSNRRGSINFINFPSVESNGKG